MNIKTQRRLKYIGWWIRMILTGAIVVTFLWYLVFRLIGLIIYWYIHVK
jgi:hypothetical protein